MKILAWVAMVLVALVVLIPPADAKRGGDDGRDRGGCSKEHWQIVVERDELRLCLLRK